MPKSEQKLYSEEDILLLIKFIVKEFAQIVQKWMARPTFASMFGMNSMPQGNMNTMLLTTLLARETANLQQQEMIHSQIMQQINSMLLGDIMDQSRNLSGDSSPLDRSKNISVNSFPPINAEFVNKVKLADNIATQEPIIRDEENHVKINARLEPELKDEVETIQSSEDKTIRNRSNSDDPNFIPVKRIDLNQAYSILEQNSVLHSLIKTFSNTTN